MQLVHAELFEKAAHSSLCRSVSVSGDILATS